MLLSQQQKQELVSGFETIVGQMVYVQEGLPKSNNSKTIDILDVVCDDDKIYLINCENEDKIELPFEEIQDIYIDDGEELFTEDVAQIHIRLLAYGIIQYDFKNCA